MFTSTYEAGLLTRELNHIKRERERDIKGSSFIEIWTCLCDINEGNSVRDKYDRVTIEGIISLRARQDCVEGVNSFRKSWGLFHERKLILSEKDA